MIEIWKDIENYEDIYQVSNLGNIRNKKTNKILKPAKDHSGYLIVNLSKNNKHKTKTIHRLVAKAFISNNDNKSQVNHKNGIKTDNNVINLEWATASENLKHAYKNKLKKVNKWQKEFIANEGKKLSKKINQYNKEGNFIKKWNSIRDIERELGISNVAITHCCKGQTKTSGGYIWKYEVKE